MENLRTVEEIAREDRTRTIYCVASVPQWEHYDDADCPGPIVDWVRAHCPGADIERLYGFEDEYVFQSEGPDEVLSAFAVGPVFRLGFTAEQAQLFRDHWHSEAAIPPRDFFLFTCYVGEALPADHPALGDELFRPMV